jgi:hypothetical protein
MGGPPPAQSGGNYTAPPPLVDYEAQRLAAESADKAKRARRNAAGYSSTILTSGLGVLDTPTVKSNTLG